MGNGEGSEVRGQKLEVRGQQKSKCNVGNKKYEVRS